MADIRFVRGETPTYRLVATREDLLVAEDDPARVVPVDMRQAKVWFTAKLRKGDAAATIAKGNTATGLDGITVLPDEPGNLADITFEVEDAEALTKTAQLAYDIKVDTGTEIAVIEEGTLTVQYGVTPIEATV